MPGPVAIGLFAIVSLGIPAWWGLNGLSSPFLYAKVVSVGIAAALVVWMSQDWRAATHPALAWIAIVVLGVNIAEAMAAELLTHVSANVFAGLLLILGIPGPSAISVLDPERTGTRFRYDLTWAWIAAYTLWNFAFVYGTAAPGDPLGKGAAMAVLHLGVPLLLAWGRADRWMQARTFALCFTFVSFWNSEPVVDGSPLYHPLVARGFGWSALILSAVALVVQRRR